MIPFVVAGAGALASAFAAGTDGTIAVAAPLGSSAVRVTLRAPGGHVTRATVHIPAARIARLQAAVDARGAATIAWDGSALRGRVGGYAATLSRRGALLAPVVRVPLPRRMELFGMAAGAGRRVVLLVNVPDNLQADPQYCSFDDIAFAGDNYFASVKTERGRFGRPASVGTGDSYAGTGFLADGRAVSADGYGDVARWPVSGGGCTRWLPWHVPGARHMHSDVALATAADGSPAWAGQPRRGFYVASGDEETAPPSPAAGRLFGVVVSGRDGRGVPLGRGAAPAVAALPHAGAAFAWLDRPAPGGFGGPGGGPPSQLWLAVLEPSGRLHGPLAVGGMLANPLVAAVPQVAAGTDGTVAVLEAATRYRLAVRHADGTLSAARDAGDVSAVSRSAVLSAGRRVYLVHQGSSSTRVTRLR